MAESESRGFLILDLPLVENARNLGHPCALIFAEKLALWWQRVRLVHCASHHVSPIISCRLPKLQDSATAGPAEFARELRPRPVVRHMHFRISGRVSKRGDGNLGGKAKGGAKESLDIVKGDEVI